MRAVRTAELTLCVAHQGYGQTGPYAKNPGYDVNIEAEAGLMHITGEPTGPPVKVGVASEWRADLRMDSEPHELTLPGYLLQSLVLQPTAVIGYRHLCADAPCLLQT